MSRFEGRIKTSINFEEKLCALSQFNPGVGTLRHTLAMSLRSVGVDIIRTGPGITLL